MPFYPFSVSRRLARVARRISLCGAAMLLPHAVFAIGCSITSPANNTVVTAGQIISVTASASGDVIGIQSLTISGQSDADGFDDVYTFSCSFPLQPNPTRTGSYRVPLSATNGQTFTISATAVGCVDGPALAAITVIVGGGSPPGNDNFVNATTLSGQSGSIANGSNSAATKEAGEPNHAGNTGGKSVWFKWTAPVSKTVSFDTLSSNFDTLLGVYTGPAVNSLTTIASNDQFGGNQSKVTFNAISGTTYYIAVDGWSGASGSVNLAWALSNDTFIDLPDDPIGYAYSPQRDRLYVSLFSLQRIEIINPNTKTVEGNIPVGQSINGLDVSPDGQFLAMAAGTSRTVSLLNLNTNTVVATTSTLPFDADQFTRVRFMDANRVLVGSGTSGFAEPFIWNTATNAGTLLDVIPGFSEPSAPHNICYSASGNYGALIEGNSSSSDYYALNSAGAVSGFFDSSSYASGADASEEKERILVNRGISSGPVYLYDKNLVQTFQVGVGTVGPTTFDDACFLPSDRIGGLSQVSSSSAISIFSASNGSLLSQTPISVPTINISSCFLHAGKYKPDGTNIVFVFNRAFGTNDLYIVETIPTPAAARGDWTLYE